MSGFELRKSGIKELLLDIVFPNKCPLCSEAVYWKNYCCDKCFDKGLWIRYDKGDICRCCGHYVCRCYNIERVYDSCYSAGFYSESVREAVIALKYECSTNAAEIFAEMIYRQMLHDGNTDYDFIVPVPMNERKQRKRGYNQAEILAERLSARLGTEIRNDLLIHSYSRSSQHDRTAEERAEFAEKEYYTADNVHINGGKILLCDDVLTTGSTINRCAYLLKEAGAGLVTAAVCAVTL